MIPVLYAANETDFTTYGIGALRDTTSCIVTEQYNGEFEMIMQYPITGKLYEELAAERIIKAKAWDVRDPQLFRIYRISRPLRGIVTIYAQHISYDLAGIALAPFSGSYTAAGAMAYMFTGTPYTGISDKSGTKTVKTIEPKSVRAMLGGSEGSLLDLWGGEYTFDNFTVKLNVHRGSDKGVVIEYGKNLTELTADNDLTEVYTQLQPYARYTDSSETEHVVTAPAISITSVISRTKTLIRDFTDALQLDQGVVPTAAQITAAATSWLSDNTLGYETPSITVSFEPAKGGANYPVVGLELGDTVTIRYTKLGVDVKARIVETEYDTLADRYKKMTVGKPRANMAATVASLTETAQAVQEYPNRWSDAIAAATKLITGNSGGYVVIHEGTDGKPYEILIMDTPDINTAVNVWRWNINGLGFSSNGYAGPYATAITYDGSINADFITSGTINADLIQAGRLTVYDSNDDLLFDADKDNNAVTIGGFTVEDERLTASTEPDATHTRIVNVATEAIGVQTEASGVLEREISLKYPSYLYATGYLNGAIASQIALCELFIDLVNRTTGADLNITPGAIHFRDGNTGADVELNKDFLRFMTSAGTTQVTPALIQTSGTVKAGDTVEVGNDSSNGAVTIQRAMASSADPYNLKFKSVSSRYMAQHGMQYSRMYDSGTSGTAPATSGSVNNTTRTPSGYWASDNTSFSSATKGSAMTREDGFVAKDGSEVVTHDSNGLSWEHATGAISSMRMFTLQHSSTVTAETTYTIDLPYGTYLFLHSRQTAPSAASTGMQLVIIGQSVGSSAIIKTTAESGAQIGATSGTRSQVEISTTRQGATSESTDRIATVTWTVQGLSYRRLVMVRLM